MARFRAYTSDSDSSSNSDEEDQQSVEEKLSQKPKSPYQASRKAFVEDESESGDNSSASEMQEDELRSSPVRKIERRRTPNRRALVEDEDGEYQFAHEVEARPSPPSSPERPSSHKPNLNNHGDPTIIPWAQHVGVEAQKMHVMQTALFRMPEHAANLRALNEPPKGGIKLDISSKTNRKHGRDSDGEGMRLDFRERASFGQDIEPQILRPTRKYARVGITSSIANDNEGSYVDAGLAMGRSFRVGWGPGGRLVHLGNICSPGTTTTVSANSSSISITKILPTISTIRPELNGSPSSSPKPPIIAAKLLQHHLSHTTISRDDSNIPCAYPTPPPSASTQAQSTPTFAPAPSTDPLNFSSFASLFPTIDTSPPAPIFRLGSALFDPIDLHLGRPKPSITVASNITPDLRNRVDQLRRKTALSKWLEDVVKPTVDGELRLQSNGSNATYTQADAAFTQLTGHQITEACETAANGGYLKLATLISQAGGDDTFKDDIFAQLDIWKTQKLSPGSNKAISNSQHGLVGRGVWRIYTLLAGLARLQDDDNNTPLEEDIFTGLDWKRVFGLYLWYGTGIDASVAGVVTAYERIMLHQSGNTSFDIAQPIPKWASSSKTGAHLPSVPGRGLGIYENAATRRETDPEDPLYALIKLHADPALSLTNMLNPLSFAPSAMDWGIGMCWHLYILLSRVMRVRDFSDRGDPGVRNVRGSAAKSRGNLVNSFGGGNRGFSSSVDERSSKDDGEDGDNMPPEGHSPTADLLASSYAFELESWGMVQEAAFVLLHLEGSVGREKALKDLLARSGPKLNDWMTRGLVGSLKLPMTWVDEAKAMYELDCGNVFAAYELYISAQLYNSAHIIALHELAPDAIIRKDLELLRSLFTPFDSDGKRDKIEGWFVRGQVILDYVETLSQLPQLLDAILAENEDGEVVPDATQTERVDTLAKRIPRIIALLPDILHRSRLADARHAAALEEMTKDLLKLEERAQPLLLSQIHQSTLGALDGATKINLIKGLGYARFLQSVEVV